jgi:hypothetical protein
VKRILPSGLLIVALAACSGAAEPSESAPVAIAASPSTATEAPAATDATATETPTEEATEEATVEPTEAATATPAATVETISLQGKGSRKTKPFTMFAPAQVNLKYNGSGNFISSIQPVGGTVLDAVGLSNTIGKTTLTTYVYETEVDGVKSYLDVLAGSGGWTVKITPDVPAPKSAPASFSGKWGLRTEPISLSGDFTVTFTHEGRGNFIASLMLVGGSILDSESVSNEIGRVDDSTEVYGLDGDYYFDVVADGAWTISIAPQG